MNVPAVPAGAPGVPLSGNCSEATNGRVSAYSIIQAGADRAPARVVLTTRMPLLARGGTTVTCAVPSGSAGTVRGGSPFTW